MSAASHLGRRQPRVQDEPSEEGQHACIELQKIQFCRPPVRFSCEQMGEKPRADFCGLLWLHASNSQFGAESTLILSMMGTLSGGSSSRRWWHAQSDGAAERPDVRAANAYELLW